MLRTNTESINVAEPCEDYVSYGRCIYVDASRGQSVSYGPSTL
jgi:hypothetical protein